MGQEGVFDMSEIDYQNLYRAFGKHWDNISQGYKVNNPATCSIVIAYNNYYDMHFVPVS